MFFFLYSLSLHTIHNSCCFHYTILFSLRWAKVRCIKEMSSNRNGISSSQIHYATWLFFERITQFLQRTSIDNEGGGEVKFRGLSNKEKIRSKETTKIMAIYFRWKKNKEEEEKKTITVPEISFSLRVFKTVRGENDVSRCQSLGCKMFFDSWSPTPLEIIV